jgi:hypothetical protein
MQSSKTLIFSSLGAVAVGVMLFFGIQFSQDASRNEAQALKDEANKLACETYMKYSYVNFKPNMTRADYEENYKAIQMLAVLGGDSEYLSLLKSIAREYELALEGKDGEPIMVMLQLNNWCAPYLSD